MWTKEHRARHEPHLKNMVSACAEEAVAHWLERADPPRNAAATPTLAAHTGDCTGDWLASARRWPMARLAVAPAAVADGVWLVPALAGAWPIRSPDVRGCGAAAVQRGADQRQRWGSSTHRRSSASPCAARVDDAAKLMVGRKRVVLVDADGVWLAINTLPALVQERDTLSALDIGSTHWPSLRLAIFDGACVADRCREWANFHGMRHHPVSRKPGQKGFVVLPRRWVVERSFGWLVHWGGLLRERAGRLDVSSGRLESVRE